MGCGASTANAAAVSEKKSMNPKVLFVLGGPGSGKGTQCERLVNEFHLKHISAGDCLREERSKESSKFKELIDKYIADGQIVPVEITVNLLKNKMKSTPETTHFLIDGFPRNMDNLTGWRDHTKGEVDVLGCLFIECSETTMEERLLKRGETSGRADDNAESIKKRFVVYQGETMPIVNTFDKEGKLFKVNGDRDVEEVWSDVNEIAKTMTNQ